MLCCYLSSWPMVGTQQTFDAEINPYLSGPSALKTPPYPKSQSLFNNPSSFQCHWAKKLELTLTTLVCTPIAAINLLYDLKQVIILLQVIFKSSLSPDPGSFPILLLLSPWSKLNRSNLVLTKSLCWDAACNLFRWTQCFPSVWRFLGGVNGGCQVMMSGEKGSLRAALHKRGRWDLLLAAIAKMGRNIVFCNTSTWLNKHRETGINSI